MEEVKLNQLNFSFRVSGSEIMRNLKIEDVIVNQRPEGVEAFKLFVFDEKNVPIYSQVLNQNEAEDRVVVGKDFTFYDHLTVSITTEPAGSPFAVVLTFA